MKRLALPAVAALLSLAACSGTPTTQTTPQGVPQVAQGSSAPADPDKDKAAAQAYFTAIVSNDPDTMTDALKWAAPGSLAKGYAQHLANVEQSLLDGGTSEDADTLDPSGEGGVYGYCPVGEEPDSKSCNTWENVRFNGGKVVDFTVKKVDISKRLTLGSDEKIKVASLADVTFLSAYQSVQSKSLFVALRVKSKNGKINVNSYTAKYRDPSGRQATATDANGPIDFDKDSIGNVTVVFKNAKPGGVMTLEVTDSDFEHIKNVKIKTA